MMLDLSQTRPEEAMRVIESAQPIVAATPPKSVLFLTDVRGAVYNRESSTAIKAFAARNTPHIRASAVVGSDGLRAVVLYTIRLLTGRDIRSFETPEQALAWLVTR